MSFEDARPGPSWSVQVIVDEEEATMSIPSRSGSSRQLSRQVVTVAADLHLFVLAPLFRQWHLRWGATSEGVTARMPGDELVGAGGFLATRAITIDAPPEAIWPWLTQGGCRRAGWYSHDLLDNLGHPSAEEIVPDLQHLEVGQWVPMAPTPTEGTAFRVHGFTIDRWLLWAKPDSTWSWVLTPVGDQRTRLVTRVHASYDWRHPLSALLWAAVMEHGDFAMMRRMLLGIKARGERHRPSVVVPAA